MSTNLFRIKKDRLVAGVCSGLGQYFDVDPILVRAVFVITTLAGGAGILAYILLWIIMPEEKGTAEEIEKEGEKIEIKETEKKAKDTTGRRNLTAGLVLVVIGLVLLVQNLFPGFNLTKFWPLVLIIIGIALVGKRGAK